MMPMVRMCTIDRKFNHEAEERETGERIGAKGSPGRKSSPEPAAIMIDDGRRRLEWRARGFLCLRKSFVCARLPRQSGAGGQCDPRRRLVCELNKSIVDQSLFVLTLNKRENKVSTVLASLSLSHDRASDQQFAGVELLNCFSSLFVLLGWSVAFSLPPAPVRGQPQTRPFVRSLEPPVGVHESFGPSRSRAQRWTCLECTRSSLARVNLISEFVAQEVGRGVPREEARPQLDSVEYCFAIYVPTLWIQNAARSLTLCGGELRATRSCDLIRLRERPRWLQ